MKKAILFDFRVDKENKQIKVKRSFEGPLPLIWQAWTDAEILDQWWAPHPWKAKTINMDFREGGQWFYTMVSPEGVDTHWCLVNFRTIVDRKSFTSDDSFCNQKGEIIPEFPSNQWKTVFTDSENETVVDVTLSFEKLEDLEKIVQMGFKEGFTLGMEQLDEWLHQQNK
ncbi:MAG TPA: SRPBCC domain-containing protein [Puia sp.]|nr:SRPBCC domain-containing protein [Puia sp.]